LKSIWIHWVVASLASATTITNFVQLIDGHLHLEPPIAVILLMVLLGVLGYVQQVILQQAGLAAKYWVLSSLGGNIAGLLFGWIGARLGALLGSHSFFWAITCALVGGSSCWGLVLGMIQYVAIGGPSWRYLFWGASSGLGLMPGIGVLIACNNVTMSAVVASLILGGSYGMITGSALVVLLCLPPQSDRFSGDSAGSPVR
jgi:hypothetical protein